VLRQVIAGSAPLRVPRLRDAGRQTGVRRLPRKDVRDRGALLRDVRPAPPAGVRFMDDCRDCEGGEYLFDRCRSAFLYEPPVSGIVKKFKFRHNVHLGDFIGSALAGFMKREPEMFEATRKRTSSRRSRSTHSGWCGGASTRRNCLPAMPRKFLG